MKKRLLIALAAGVVVVALAALAAVHIIVAGRTLRNWVNTSPRQLFLDYDAASAWTPGVIRIHGLTMRGSDPNVQWSFRMEDAVISVSLAALLRREFHATEVTARGLVFRLRERHEKAELSPAHERRVPEVSGFADPPLAGRAESSPPPSTSEARHRFWSIHVQRLVADPTSDIWIELYRFRGHARVSGEFFLHPHLQARVGPAAVEFLSGDLTLGSMETLLQSMTGRSTCAIDSYSPDAVEGNAIWQKISGKIDLAGRLEDLRFLDYFLRRTPEPRLSGGAGPARFDVAITHGIGKGSAEFQADGMSAKYAAGTLSGRVAGRLEIPRWDLAKGRMEISGSLVDLSHIETIGTRRDARDWWGRFRVSSGVLQDGLDARVALSARDARPLYTLFRAELPGWAQGILTLDGVNGNARVRLASDLVDVRDMEAEGGKFRLAGRYRQTGKERTGAFLVETGPLAVGVAIDSDSSHVKLLGARKWFRESNP